MVSGERREVRSLRSAVSAMVQLLLTGLRPATAGPRRGLVSLDTGSLRRTAPAGKACQHISCSGPFFRRPPGPLAQPLAPAQLAPVAIDTVSGTLRSAAPVRAD